MIETRKEFSDAGSWTDFSMTRNCEVARGLDLVTKGLDTDADAIGNRYVEVGSFVGDSGERHFVGIFSISSRDSTTSCEEVLDRLRNALSNISI